MKANTAILIWAVAMGCPAFCLAHTQTEDVNNTAHVSAGGSITRQNPSDWISTVFFQSGDGVGARGVYEVIFHDTAPSASSCTATPDSSDLTGIVEAPAAQPNQLLVSFRESGSNGGVATPVPSAFTLSCARSS